MNTDDQKDNQHDNEVADKTLTVLEKILATTENIWEKYSQEIMPSGGGEAQERDTREGEEVETPQQGQQQGGRGGAGIQSTVLGGANQGLSILGQSDPNYILPGIVSMIPYVGSGLGVILQNLINAAEKQDVALAKFRGSAGYGYNLGSFADIGLNMGEAAEKAAQYAKANIGVSGYDLRFEKGYNLSAGTIDALLRSTRQEYREDYSQVREIQKSLADAREMAKREREHPEDFVPDEFGLAKISYRYDIDGREITAEELAQYLEGELDTARANVRRSRVKDSGSVMGQAFLQDLVNKGQINRGEVRAYSEDYLKILVDLNQKQLELTGETNSILNSDVVASIARLDDHFGDPTVLSRVVSSLQGGLTQARSPQIEAMQYWALAETNPGASLWQMQMMRENPFGEESRGYLSNFLSGMLQTGNIDDIKFNIQHTFGLSAHQTEQLVSGILTAKEENRPEFQDTEGKFDLRKYLEVKKVDFSPAAAEAKISAEAAAATSGTEATLTSMEDFLAARGSSLIGEISPEMTKAVVGGVASAAEGVLEAADCVSKFFTGEKNIMDLFGELASIIGSSIADVINLGGNSGTGPTMASVNNPNPTNSQIATNVYTIMSTAAFK